MKERLDFVRRTAIALIAGAAATAAAGIAVQAVVQPRTDVSDDLWSYPWSSDALVVVSIPWAALHVLVLVGLLGFAQSGLAGAGRGARAGAGLAVAGTALLFVGELASIPIRHQHVDDTGATIVGGIYGAGSVLTAIGLLAAGVATLRGGRWHGWGRFTPLAAGVTTTALIGIGVTKALPTGIALYGLSLLALGAALYGEASPARGRARRVRPQEHAA